MDFVYVSIHILTEKKEKVPKKKSVNSPQNTNQWASMEGKGII